MDERSSDELERRVLLLPPTKRDAGAAAAVFEAVKLPLTVCADIDEVCNEIERGAAVAIVTDEAVLNDRQGRLSRLLKEQPGWSDIPLIVLTPPTQTAAAARAMEKVGHMTLMRRPIEIRSLLSTVQAALRDRQRQYALRADLLERERQAQALLQNDRHKDEFLAMLAHELRNPLAAVNNAVSVLRLTDDEAARAWAGDVIERQVRQLVRLIDDLLDVSRITRGKIQLRKEFTDASVPLDHALEAVQPLIDARRHTLGVAIERGRLPVYVDVTRVAQIVLNLLTNAAKYTEDGGRIELSARREGGEAIISVRDNGTGIPPDRLPEMFHLFSQGDRSLARSEGGLGIGLTLVQKLTEMHRGRIEAHSEGPGQGSEFVVRLPLARRSAPAAPKAPSTGPPRQKRSRILIVDDNEDTALGMLRLLKLLGNEVVAAYDGPGALAAARSFRPDVVLLDIGLPGMNGYQVASALRQDEDDRHILLIALSGYGQDEDRRRSQAAGFDHHLVKPVDFESLLALVGQNA